LNAEEQNVALRELAKGARAAGRIALDTEFMGEGRYQTLLCLIQLAIPASDGASARVEIVDPLASDLDGAPLAAILADPAVQVVVHAGRQDVALLRRRFAAEVRNVFDTQVAAGFLGMGAHSSYHSLLAEILDVHLAKGASFTRWDARPLSDEQLGYAREDVEHLLELAAELGRRLEALGRSEWAREECEPLADSSDKRDPEAVFSRLPRVGGLSSASRPIARELVSWRERTAARQNRPVQSVLSDVALIEVAKRKPSSRHELERIRGIGAAGSRQRAQEVLDVVRGARTLPADPAPQTGRAPASRTEDGPLVALAEALLRTRAIEAGLAYELLATRAELQALVAAHRAGTGAVGRDAAGAGADGGPGEARILRGWRRELAGEQLLELLDGRISLSVREDRAAVAIRCGCRLRTAADTSRSR